MQIKSLKPAPLSLAPPSAWAVAFSDNSVYYQLVGLSESWGLCLSAVGSTYPTCGSAAGSVVQMTNCQGVAPAVGQCDWDAQYWKYVPVTAGPPGSYSFVQRQALRLDGVNRCLTSTSDAAGATFTIAMCGTAGPAGDPAVPLASQTFSFTP